MSGQRTEDERGLSDGESGRGGADDGFNAAADLGRGDARYESPSRVEGPSCDDAEAGQTPPQLLGHHLAEARHEAGLSIETLAQSTRIRGRLLREIEAGDLARCGGDVYARGHIRAIARVVKIDPEPLIREYLAVSAADSIQTAPMTIPARGKAQSRVIRPAAPAPRPKQQALAPARPAAYSPPLPARASEPARRGKLGTKDTIGRAPKGANWTAAMLGVLLALVVFAGMQLYGRHGKTAGAPAAQPVAPSTAARPAGPPPPPPAPTSIAFRISAVDAPSWLSVVSSDGRKLYDSMLTAGSVQAFQDGHQLAVVVGNGAAVRIQLNGKDLGNAGGQGQVVRLTVKPTGVVAG